MDKQEIMKKMEDKGITVAQMAETIQFDPMVLGLYLAQDAYPVPKRIMDKLSAAVSN